MPYKAKLYYCACILASLLLCFLRFVHCQIQVCGPVRTFMRRRFNTHCRRVLLLGCKQSGSSARCCHFTAKVSCRASLHSLNAILCDQPQFPFVLHTGKPYSSCTALHTKSRLRQIESHSQCAFAKQQEAFIGNGARRLPASISNHTTQAMCQVSMKRRCPLPPCYA